MLERGGLGLARGACAAVVLLPGALLAVHVSTGGVVAGVALACAAHLQPKQELA